MSEKLMRPVTVEETKEILMKAEVSSKTMSLFERLGLGDEWRESVAKRIDQHAPAIAAHHNEEVSKLTK